MLLMIFKGFHSYVSLHLPLFSFSLRIALIFFISVNYSECRINIFDYCLFFSQFYVTIILKIQLVLFLICTFDITIKYFYVYIARFLQYLCN